MKKKKKKKKKRKKKKKKSFCSFHPLENLTISDKNIS